MTLQSYQPQIDARVYENAAKQKRLVRMLVGWVALAAFILLSLKYYDRLRSFLFGASSEARLVTSNSPTEKSRHPNSTTSRRTNSTHRTHGVALLAPEGEVKLASDLAESTMRPPLIVEVISGGGRRQLIRTHDDSIYLDSNGNAFANPSLANAPTGYPTDETKADGVPSQVVEVTAPLTGSAPLSAKAQPMEGAA